MRLTVARTRRNGWRVAAAAGSFSPSTYSIFTVRLSGCAAPLMRNDPAINDLFQLYRYVRKNLVCFQNTRWRETKAKEWSGVDTKTWGWGFGPPWRTCRAFSRSSTPASLLSLGKNSFRGFWSLLNSVFQFHIRELLTSRIRMPRFLRIAFPEPYLRWYRYRTH